MLDLISKINSLEYTYPWVFLPALLIIFFSYRNQKEASNLLHPSVKNLMRIRPTFKARFRAPILNILWLLFVLSLTLAASKPHITQTLTDDSPKRNLILALDVSGSMGTADFGGSYGTASRLAAVKHVVGEFLKIRTEDRIGIVVFGNKAFLQSPLTSDLNLLETLVSGLSVGVAGDGTAIPN